MVALVVVLGQSLPVRRSVVTVPSGGHQAFRLVRRDQFVQLGQRVGQRPRGAARTVHEHQPVPLGCRQRGQAPLAEVESALVPETCRRAELTGKRVRPGVVRADDHLLPGALTARQQLMTAVAAAVRERPHLAVLGADQQHAALPGGLGALVARLGQLVAACYAHPSAAEEVSLLPVEHRRIDIRRPRQHPAFPERPQRPFELTAIKRSRGRTGPQVLTDHTVKTKPPARACPGRPGRLECFTCQLCACVGTRAPSGIPGVPAVSALIGRRPGASLRITGRGADTAMHG